MAVLTGVPASDLAHEAIRVEHFDLQALAARPAAVPTKVPAALCHRRFRLSKRGLRKRLPKPPSPAASKAKSRVAEDYEDTMLIRILSFLLETIFFLLIGASLLRAWMNWMRVNMRLQPGSFVMALTDWLVKPLRRALPAQLLKSRIDWASVIAAMLFALVYALLWSVIFGLLLGAVNARPDFAPAGIISLVLFALKMLIRVALQTMTMLLIGFAILSWVQQGSPAYALLGRLTEPLLAPLRRVIPPVGGVDLSALVLILALQVGLMVLG